MHGILTKHLIMHSNVYVHRAFSACGGIRHVLYSFIVEICHKFLSFLDHDRDSTYEICGPRSWNIYNIWARTYAGDLIQLCSYKGWWYVCVYIVVWVLLLGLCLFYFFFGGVVRRQFSRLQIVHFWAFAYLHNLFICMLTVSSRIYLKLKQEVQKFLLSILWRWTIAYSSCPVFYLIQQVF